MSVQSFNALCNAQTHTLILGTMPGIASLDAIEYYAHQRNAFWPIMLALTEGVPASYELPKQFDYPTRTAKLLNAGIGLWDVLAECEREGSLDAAIKTSSIVVNDFAGLLSRYTAIKTIAFNGKTAQKLFLKHVLPELNSSKTSIEHVCFIDLPSTSPAMASLNLANKCDRWHEVIRPH